MKRARSNAVTEQRSRFGRVKVIRIFIIFFFFHYRLVPNNNGLGDDVIRIVNIKCASYYGCATLYKENTKMTFRAANIGQTYFLYDNIDNYLFYIIICYWLLWLTRASVIIILRLLPIPASEKQTLPKTFYILIYVIPLFRSSRFDAQLEDTVPLVSLFLFIISRLNEKQIIMTNLQTIL